MSVSRLDLRDRTMGGNVKAETVLHEHGWEKHAPRCRICGGDRTPENEAQPCPGQLVGEKLIPWDAAPATRPALDVLAERIARAVHDIQYPATVERIRLLLLTPDGPFARLEESERLVTQRDDMIDTTEAQYRRRVADLEKSANRYAEQRDTAEARVTRLEDALREAKGIIAALLKVPRNDQAAISDAQAFLALAVEKENAPPAEPTEAAAEPGAEEELRTRARAIRKRVFVDGCINPMPDGSYPVDVNSCNPCPVCAAVERGALMALKERFPDTRGLTEVTSDDPPAAPRPEPGAEECEHDEVKDRTVGGRECVKCGAVFVFCLPCSVIAGSDKAIFHGAPACDVRPAPPTSGAGDARP